MKIEDRVLRRFHFRASNALTPEMISDDLGLSAELTIDILRGLQKKGLLTCKQESVFALPPDTNVPIRQYIQVGSTRFRRILATDPVLAEAINMQVERLAHYSDSLEGRFRSIVAKRMRSYWASVITLFGVFVALFSFVASSAAKIQIQDAWSFWEIVWRNLAQLLPLATVLLAFVILLRVLFR